MKDELLNRIELGDCIAGLNALEAGSVDLVFADPPFNIGYDYDVYRDRLERDHYLAWSRDWISGVFRALSPRGTFWLAIGDEYAAELKLESQRIGFIPRSWVVWYYTFGVNCSHKFTRSHAHLFYFVKDANDFTFRDEDLENRIPSARQLVYADKRANPRGRLPDDTWLIRPADVVGEMVADDETWAPSDFAPPSDNEQTWTLRPQDLAERFQENEHTWYFPRVAGTFKERAGFHGCQMPEQLLGRIIRFCSNEGDLVVDPFSGSATTLAVAKKLGRRYLGFDVSADYVKLGQQRLAGIRVGDRLDGSPEPTMSAPTTNVGRPGLRGPKQNKPPRARHSGANVNGEIRSREKRFERNQAKFMLRGVVEAFERVHDGYSADYVVANPDLDSEFVRTCERLGIVGDPRTWNVILFRLRKAGKLKHISTTRRSDVSWEDCDHFLFASEIALKKMLDDKLAVSLDEILCDPDLAREFDNRAFQFAPGLDSFMNRWGALALRKRAKLARSRGALLQAPATLAPATPLLRFDPDVIRGEPGVYVVANRFQSLYVGATLNLRERLRNQFGQEQRMVWLNVANDLGVQARSFPNTRPGEILAWQSCFVRKYRPQWNLRELCRLK
ncbi:MAG TPA: DNA methyltransferase [Pirellulales bacterium]|jgi:site-specific DNA-methyltransferase (adenine-specific)|nr:DNA methyltransferase [Pirellulales bacterium]